MALVLLISVFVIATCGLVYELISGALASYLLGDSVTQFSTIIGTYLFFMGVGSWLSKYINRNLIGVFVQVELLIGLVGGCSAAILFVSFEYISAFRILLYSLVGIIGTLVGLELPLLMRILKNQFEFKELVSRVFTFDYIGALIASILFPLVFVPHMGLIRTSFFFGILNVLVALWALLILEKEVAWASALKAIGVLLLAGLAFGFVYSDRIMSFAEVAAYPEKIIYSKTSRYQRIVITRSGEDLRLYLNGNLQFNSRDEYRYHESLVHPGMSALDNPKKVLVLGGGDGLAVREILKYPSVQSVLLVDLDPKITELFSSHKSLISLNSGSLSSAKVKIVNEDAFVWLKQAQDRFDFIVIDFPDPSNFSIGKLYTNAFYKLVNRVLSDDGLIAVQSTSPFVARKSFWCVNQTLRAVGFLTTPYHAYVPSFGDWGFLLASRKPFKPPSSFPPDLKFVSWDTMQGMLHFPDDMKVKQAPVNKLNNQILVQLFEEEWEEYAY